MKRLGCVALMVAGMAVVFSPGVVVAQRVPGAQVQQQQARQLAMLQEHMQRLEQIRERAHVVNQEWARLMERERVRVTEQHHVMQQLGEGVESMTEVCNRLMERTRTMLRDRAMMGDGEMAGEVERFRNRLGELTGQLEEMVQSMERMTARFRHIQG